MKTIYTIVASSELEKIKKIVNHKLADGWELAGGIAVDFDHIHYSRIYYQAMIKRMKDDDNA